MIDNALNLIKDALNSYLSSKHGEADRVVMDNVAMLDGNGSSLEDKVIISLVNIEEERAFKSAKTLMNTVVADNNVTYEKRPAFLNLYILICPNLQGGTPSGQKYLDSLRLLSSIVRFFQNKNYFTAQNSPGASDFENFKLTMDMYSLTLEQINHLWGSLGGKQLPFVMYKARVVELEDKHIDKKGQAITDVSTDESVY